jgi:hypothetical protein
MIAFSSLNKKLSKQIMLKNPIRFISEEIRISSKGKGVFYPIREIPKFEKGIFTVFEYKPAESLIDEEGEYKKLPQVPYEIKEHALKGFIYTFFLIWGGRLLSSFSLNALNMWSITMYPVIPLSVFTYHYLRPLHYMANAITAIRLKEDGQTVIFEFKNFRKPLEVETWRIQKGKEENFLHECFSEPFLFPITIDYNDIYGKFSIFNEKKFFIYGDSNVCIKHGEILRAILNSQNIKLN